MAFTPLVARSPADPHRAATPLELFFDLVIVIAIASLTGAFHHTISEAHGLAKLPSFAFFFVAIWWVWMNFTWYASAFDNDDALHRLLTIVIMFGATIFAAGVAAAYVNAAIAVYLAMLWLVRDRCHDLGWRKPLLLIFGLVFAVMAVCGVKPEIAAVVLILVLALRIRPGARNASAHLEHNP